MLQGGRINLDAQLDNYANTRQEIISSLGMASASTLLHKSLFSVIIGSNDFINNYLAPMVSIPQRATTPPETFIEDLISKYRLQLTVILHSYISFFFQTKLYLTCNCMFCDIVEII